MPKGSVGTPTNIVRRVPTPIFKLGVKCAKCERYLFAQHKPRISGPRQWVHTDCADLSEPEEVDFQELAVVLAERSKRLRDAARQVLRCAEMVSIASLVDELNALSPRAPIDAATPTKDRAQQMLAEAQVAYQLAYEPMVVDRLVEVRSSWRN